jgi:hypothetical protein
MLIAMEVQAKWAITSRKSFYKLSRALPMLV